MRGPDFVGVGAPRAGTSWLHEVLGRHPQLWLPPIKELHYFDEPDGTKRYYSYLRMRLISGFWIKRPLGLFDFHYFLGRRSDAWYCKLFAPAQRRGLIAGEITPAYSVVDDSALRRLWRLNPKTKLIYIMRDPVDRSWSAVVKKHHGRVRLGLPDLETAIRYAREEGIQKRSSYMESIAKFERVFAREQIFYGFFEDLSQNPGGFVAALLRFLGAEPGEIAALLPKTALNVAAAGRQPPEAFARALAADYFPWVEKLSERFDGPPRVWQSRYEAILGGSVAVDWEKRT